MASNKVLLAASILVVGIFFLLFSGIVFVPRQLIDWRQEAAVLRMSMDNQEPVLKSDVATEAKPQYDVIDNSGATDYLRKYAQLFSGGQLSSDVQPNIPSSIVTWWEAAAMIDWYINAPVRYQCRNHTRMGNWHVCQDGRFTIKPPCLVYSFGINFDFSFDDDMGRLGCEVHSFDPSMKKDDHKRSQNVTFHNLGLGNFNADAFDPRQDMYVKDDQRWKMRTLKSVVEMLGHENRVIDVLKIDVEGHEWAVVENMFETNMFQYVRQFMTEWHLFPTFPAKQEYVRLYQMYTKLRERGFREFSRGPHPKTLDINKFNNQGDSEYVNIFFQKKSGWSFAVEGDRPLTTDH